MDLNPRLPWTLEGGPYELADHCLKTRSNLLILLDAWLDSEEEQDIEEDISTMNYWATFLRPLWHRKGNGSSGEGAQLQETSEDAETIVVVCNRCGAEKGEHHPTNETPNSKHALSMVTTAGVTFAGSSALFRFRPSAGKPLLLENMSRRQEGVCVWTT
jgi:protein N-terminal amidase